MNKGLSLRLQACLDALYPLQIVADIGTDHAYLPCVGILNNQLTKAIAVDIGVGPLERAMTTVKRYQLQDQIELRMGSGLTVLSPEEVEGVVISGMGGKLIYSILEENVFLTKTFKRLVLQPNIEAHLVRTWLANHQYKITDERMILEDDKFYEIVVAELASNPIAYTALDLQFGPILRQKSDEEIFIAKWQKNLIKIEQIITQLPVNHPRIKNLTEYRQQIKEVLNL